jgi:predicted permease
MYLSILAETINVTGPIFILVLLGIGLKRIDFLDDHFIQISSRLVFTVCLPVLLFTTIIGIDIKQNFNLALFNFSIVASSLTFVLSWFVAVFLVTPREDRGVFVQACFRSNLGVVGLALCANAYGAEGLVLASLLIASMTAIYNVLSVVVLSYYNVNRRVSVRQVILDIFKNPLIISILLAVAVSLLNIPIPGIFISAGEYLGSLALPLALLGTGAGINLKALRDSSFVTLLTVLMKTMLLPLVVTLFAWQLGFTGVALGVLFLLFVSPTATASFIMVKSMGGNDGLAANLIMVTTLVGILTSSLGLFLLRLFGLA